MAKSTVEEMFQDYYNGMTGSTEKIRRGVERTQKSQSQNAIKAIPLMKQRINEALDSGRVAEGLRRSGDEKWRRNTLEKGLGKIGVGITANQDEIKQKFQKVLEVGDQVSNAVKDMPKGTLEQSVARARKAMETAKKGWGKM